jgi:hypothetical protein
MMALPTVSIVDDEVRSLKSPRWMLRASVDQ